MVWGESAAISGNERMQNEMAESKMGLSATVVMSHRWTQLPWLRVNTWRLSLRRMNSAMGGMPVRKAGNDAPSVRTAASQSVYPTTATDRAAFLHVGD